LHCSTPIIPYLRLSRPLTTLKVFQALHVNFAKHVQDFLTTTITSKLRILSIRFIQNVTWRGMAVVSQEILLPKLKELTLRLIANEEGMSKVMPLLESLKLPNIEILTLELVYPAVQRGTFLSWWEEVNKRKEVRKVSVRFEVEEDQLDPPSSKVRESIISRLLETSTRKYIGSQPEIDVSFT
jgi:hypothetical protein